MWCTVAVPGTDLSIRWTITVQGEYGAEPVEFVMGGLELQLMLGFSIADPFAAVRTLMLFAGAERDEEALNALGQLVYENFRRDPVSMSGMSEAMDVASGISAEALSRFEEQARTSLLGGVLNFPMPYVRGAFGHLDLGPGFREAPRSDIPTLLLTGTLDGRTYPDSQREAMAGFSNLTQVMVENAGHNLFMIMPEVTETILAFMRGEQVPDRLVFELPPYGR